MKYQVGTVASFLCLSSLLIYGFQNCSKFSVQQLGAMTEEFNESTISPSVAFQTVSHEPLPGEYPIPSNNQVSASNTTLSLGAATNPSQGLEYFGYPMLYSDPQVAQEVQNHSNAVSMIFDPDRMPSEEQFKEMIRLSKSDFKMVIFVDGAFYSKSTGEMHSTETQNRNLQKLKTLLAGYEQNILAIGFDEPIWNRQFWDCGGGWNNCTEVVLNQGPTARVIDSSVLFLELAGVAIRTYFPSVSLIHIEGGPMVRTNTKFPKNYDYFGFDCYRNFNDCWGRSIPEIYSIVREHVVQLNRAHGGYRRIAIVPEAQLALDRKSSNPRQGLVAKDEAEAVALFNQYLSLISGDPMVKIMGAWIWQTFQDNEVVSVGARSLPNLRRRVIEIGAAISKKPLHSQISLPVVRLHVSPGVKVGERAIWIWSAPTATQCRSISEPSAFPRMEPQGFFVGPVEAVARSIVYTIECSNEFGSVRESVEYTVEDPNSSTASPPPHLYLAQTSFEFRQNQAISPVQFVNIGGSIQSCRASSQLPAGLAINPTNCSLTGTPTSISPASAFQIIATNAFGLSSISIRITVTSASGSTGGDTSPPASSPVFCEASSSQFQSLPNSVGEKSTCNFQVPKVQYTALRLPVIATTSPTSAIYKIICESNGQHTVVESNCPAPADPLPSTNAVFCEPQPISFQSVANSAGVKNTCTGQIPKLEYTTAAPIFTASVTPAAAKYKVRCGANGQLTVVESVCPAPADPLPASFQCDVTNPSIKSFSFSGQAIPASIHRGLRGFYFAGGYDPNENVWYSFDGAVFHKHATLNSDILSISTKDFLDAAGLSGELFRDHDLTAYPGGKIFIGYGVGATKDLAFHSMISQNTFRHCHTLSNP